MSIKSKVNEWTVGQRVGCAEREKEVFVCLPWNRWIEVDVSGEAKRTALACSLRLPQVISDPHLAPW